LIEWSSSKQVIKLFKKLGIAVKERSKHTGRLEWTVGAKSLLRKLPGKYKGKFFKRQFPDQIECKEDLSLAYLLFKKSEQLCTTFGKEWLKYVHPITYRIHPNFNQYMSTGRLSSTNPNMQNIPNTKEFRACFVSKGIWFSSDYAAQEVRVLAQVSKVKPLQDFFLVGDPFYGGDFHSFVATKMFQIIHSNPDYVVPPKELENGEDNPIFNNSHKDERNKSKNATFKMAFGGSGYTMAMDLGVDIEEGEKFVQSWFYGFPGLENNFTKTKKLAIQRGWIELDQFTRKRYWFSKFEDMNFYKNKIYELVPNYNKLTKDQKKDLPEYEEIKRLGESIFIYVPSLERKSLNYRIQGSAAMMTKIALWLVHRWRWDNNYQR
jgi:DNA polymerase I-like protein with 3'-5' exonuclease and polymerase domains